MQGMERIYLKLLFELLELFPCVAIVGVRQCGKTTLLQQLPSSCNSSTWKRAVISWETLITLFFDNFDFLTGSEIFPGAAAIRKLVVMTTAITVLILLLLKSFD